jgi:hypothetical protein
MAHDAFGDVAALHAIFHPKTVAVMGPTAEPDTLGHKTLDERRSRGEYVTPLAQLAILMAMGDVDAVRRGLQACITDTTPVQPVRTVLGPFLDQFRHDRDIDGMLERYYDGARPR